MEKPITRPLNLDDIQGNITRAYGRFSFPHARYFFLNISDPAAGRKFVDEVRTRITTARRWTPETKPLVTLNIAFTFPGLMQLELPTKTLQHMPEEYIDGMKARAFILGDRDPTKTEDDDHDWCDHWDPIWRENRTGNGDTVHIWMSMNAQTKNGTDVPVDELEEHTNWLRQLCNDLDQKVRILAKNGKKGDQEYQSASAIFETLPNGIRVPTPKEHFGFTDGIGDPVFQGQHTEEMTKKRVVGRGKWMNAEKGWEPIATGEFILGHPDEAQELPPMSPPDVFTRNGSFMSYRKLHQNLSSFEEVLDREAERYAKVANVDVAEAKVTLKAKMVGRWPDGVPLSHQSTYKEWQAFRKERGFDGPDPLKAAAELRAYLSSDEVSNFKYGDDMDGRKCPVTSHLRRSNTRDFLDPMNKPDGDNPNSTTQLNKRRRILRRGLPYGSKDLGVGTDDTEQGIAMMTICASLFRQFEFIQQQWLEYGLDFNAGNNTCPLLGNHEYHKRHAITGDPDKGTPTYVMDSLKTFVETRGGDYFFIPSMTALRMIAMGIIDPT